MTGPALRGGPTLRRLLGAVPLLVGVTLIAFTLTVHFGPDPAWEQLGRNPSAADLERVQQLLGQDRPFALRYFDYLGNLARLDLGYAHASGESVAGLIARTLPISAMLLLPGFVAGLVVALALALWAAWHPRGRIDRACDLLTAGAMSLSLVVIVIALQAIFGVALDWFPVRGWQVDGPVAYARHVAVPTLALILANLGYNLRFFRAVFRAAVNDAPVRTALAYGLGPARIIRGYVIRACAPVIVTRIAFAVPLLLVSGSLVIESHFGIPGIGKITFDAVMAGDQPVLMAIVSLSAILFVLTLTAADILAGLLDPRIATA